MSEYTLVHFGSPAGAAYVPISRYEEEVERDEREE